MKKERIGSTLESLFDELGETAEVMQLAQKKVIAEQLREAMKAKHVTASDMAKRMKTSRMAVTRLLDPTVKGVTLDSLATASAALDLQLSVTLKPRRRVSVVRKVVAAPGKRKMARRAQGSRVAAPISVASKSSRR